MAPSPTDGDDERHLTTLAVGVTATTCTPVISSGSGGGGEGAGRGDGMVVGGRGTGDWDLVVVDAGVTPATRCVAGDATAGIGSLVAGGTGSGTFATCGGAGPCRAGNAG